MMFRELTEDEQAEFGEHLRLLAWEHTRRTAGLGGTEPYASARAKAGRDLIVDQAFVTGTAIFYQGHRKDMHLQWLRMLRHLESQLGNAADELASLAAGEGANFRELGDAWGITRHGALKKWRRVVEDDAAPDAGDRVRLTYGDGSTCEGTWEVSHDGPVLRLDDGTVHGHVAGQVRREVIERA